LKANLRGKPWPDSTRPPRRSTPSQFRTRRSSSILGPKYGSLTEIAFEGFLAECPLSPGAIEEALRNLPDQFYRQPAFGLGIRKQFRPVIDVLRRKAIWRLVITLVRDTALEENALILAEQDFIDVAYELDRIATRFIEQSRAERSRHAYHAYNEILSRHFASRFPPQRGPRSKGRDRLFPQKSAPNRLCLVDCGS
jgi:hypothetical protein